MIWHELKTHPEPFTAVWEGRKTFEWRLNDRDYHSGDAVYLREYDEARGYTGRFMDAEVTYVLAGEQYGVPPGYAVLSIRVFNRRSEHSYWAELLRRWVSRK